MKSYKILKFQHLTMKADRQPGLIHIMEFITHSCWLLLGAHVSGSVDIKKCYIFKKLKIAILASGSVLTQGVYSFRPAGKMSGSCSEVFMKFHIEPTEKLIFV